jgi:hypothetical protein
MKVKIFFSWQMTTDSKYNKYFILDCIKKSVKKLKNKPELKGVEFIIQEGITGESGSVQVASKIADERIPSCDIFIADLSVVNHVNRFKQFLRKITGDKHKPFQNNNVFYEYGIAYEAIGEEKIIGVLNNSYGSPNENPDNIPFDLKHLRFPLEYKYSSQYNDKEKAQGQLISGLTGALKETAIFALQHQKDRYKPLSVWQDWKSLTNTSQKYHENEIINKVTSQIKNGIKKPNESIRLIGLSGLGKTRILLEAFRANESEESINLNSRVLYLNCNYDSSADYQSIFTKLTKEKEDRIVILDNCSRTLHRQLLHFIQNENNIISLITIDSNPEELEQDKINGVNYILIKKEDLSSIVEQILTEDFEVLGKDNIEKIKEFSQGIPLMAVLIGESIKNGEKFIGKLDDKELLDKLLGEKGQNERSRTILKSCSIFNYFGIEDELKSQLEFIATDKNITSLTGEDQIIINEFHDTCSHFLKREIFERKGRLIGLRPFPLAMSLAQEWLEPCTPDRLLNVITNIAKLEDPDRKNLSEAIAEQMKYLGYNDKAVLIIDKIVGPQSPFDNAEVLNSELGSRLFRSFVEVNPVAVSQNLVRLFSNKTKDELLKIDTGRRNLVWVLEKLCFDRRTFKESAKVLFSFAIAENETWSNNATGQLLHLFKIYLAGTEANLQERWEIIQWGLNKGNQEYYELAIRAMKSGLDFGHFSRMGGSESQGSKKLIDYQPSWAEISEYWTNILTKLTSIIKSDNSNSKSASDSIANSIRSICNARLGHIIIPFIKEIAIIKENHWDEGLEGLKFARKYEKAHLTEESLANMEALTKSLTKTDFKTRYSTISNSYHLDNDESYSSEKVKVAIIELADEFINEEISWESHFPIFYTNQQIYSYHFGKRIYELISDNPKKLNEFIDLSIKIVLDLKKEDRNVTVFGGFISEASDEIKEAFYKSLSNNEELNYLLFYFLSIDNKGKEFFYLLFELIDSDKCELDNFNVFSYSNSLGHCNQKELEKFSKKLFNYGDEGYALVFDLYFNLGYNNDELKASLLPIFKECIFRLGANKIEKRQLDNYKWSQTICSILSSNQELEFAKFINNSIIESISWENSYHLDNDVQRVYEVLMKIHFQTIWSDLSKALLSTDDDYIKFYGLKHILGSHIGGVGRSIGILFDGDIESIFEWCKSNQPLAPSRLAELVPIYGNNNNEFSTWHPTAKRLIDEFGDIEDVLRHLSSNMGTYSWTGSVVPLLEAKKELFKSIENHQIPLVSDWASKYLSYADEQIRQEKNRDEEMYL